MLWKSVGNWGDIGLPPASRETTQTDKPPKHFTKTWGQDISSLIKKKRKHTQWVSATIMVQVYQETPVLARPEGKGGKTRRPISSEREINRLPLLLAVKMIRQQISLTKRLTRLSTTLTNKRRQ